MKANDDLFIQVSVYVENKVGTIKRVAEILKNENIDIKALSLAESIDYGVLRMIVDKPEEAVKVLGLSNIQARTTEIIAIEVNDTPGGMYNVLDVLSNNGINVEYLYATVERKESRAVVVFKVDNNLESLKILKANGIKVSKKQDILKNI